MVQEKEEKYIIPVSVSEFMYGTKYQIFTRYGWSSVKTISKLCYSARAELRNYIDDGRIRIVTCEDN